MTAAFVILNFRVMLEGAEETTGMRWQQERRSDNVEDQRGRSVAAGGVKLGGGALVLILLFSLITKQNPLKLLALLSQQQESTPVSTPVDQTGSPVNDAQKEFVSAILASTEDIWGEVFSAMNRTYEPPHLVLFTEAAQTACGFSSSAVGPFYCPADSKVYLDLGFFDELSRRFGAPGDFAQAYVIAHEVGHHVQNQLGISEKVDRQRQGGSEEESNALSVRLELQADCFAGVWGNRANREKKMLEPGDVDEGLAAAAAVGDDTLQRNAGRSVSPESWTHGSSEMRTRWFTRGFNSGDINTCDTFNTSQL